MPGLGGIYRSLRPHPLCAVAQERIPLVKESFDRSSFSHGFGHSVYFVFQLLACSRWMHLDVARAIWLMGSMRLSFEAPSQYELLFGPKSLGFRV